MAGPGGMLPLSIDLSMSGVSDVTGSLDQVTVSLRGLEQQASSLNAVGLKPLPGALEAIRDNLLSVTGGVAEFETVLRSQNAVVSDGVVNLTGFGKAAESTASAVKAVGPAAEKTALSFFQLRTAMVGISAIAGINPMIGQMGAAFANLTGTMGLISPAALGVAAGVAAIGAVLVGSTKAAIDFSDAMIVDRNNMDITDKEFGSMQSSVRSMAVTTGSSMKDLGAAFRVASNEGFNFATTQQIVSIANKAAIATGAQAKDVTFALAQVMHDFNIAGTDAAQTMEMIFIAARDSNTTMQEFAQSIGKLYAEAAALGVPLKDVLATVSALGATEPAAQAVRGLTTAISHMADPTRAEYAELVKLDQEFGTNLVHAFSQAGLKADGLIPALSELKLVTDHLGESETAKLIPAIRGGIEIMAATGPQYVNIINESNRLAAANDEASAIQERYNARAGDTKEALARMGQAFHDAGIGIGTTFTPVVGGAADKITGFIGVVEAGLGTVGDMYDKLYNLGTEAGNLASGPLTALQKQASDTWTAIDNTVAANEAEDNMQGVGAAAVALGGIISHLGDLGKDAWDKLRGGQGTGGGSTTSTGGFEADTADHQIEALQSQATDLATAKIRSDEAGATRAQSAAIGALNSEQKIYNAYAGEGTDKLKAQKGILDSYLSRLEGAADILRTANQGLDKNSQDYKDNSAAIEINAKDTAGVREQLKGLNAVLDERTKGTKASTGASQADRQAALGATEAYQAQHDELVGLTKEEHDTLQNQRDLANHTRDQLLPIQEQQTAIVTRDTEAHKTLVNMLAEVRSGISGNADEIRQFNGAIDENLSRLNNQNDETGALRQQLLDAKQAFDGLTGSERDLASAAQTATAAVKAEEVAVRAAQDTVKRDQEAVTAANKVLTEYKQTVTDLTSALSAAKTAEQDFASAALPGAQAFDDQRATLTQSMNEIQLKIDQIIGTDLAKGMTTQAAEADAALIPLNAQLEILKNQQDTLSVQSALALDPMTQQIKDLEAAGNKFDFGTLIDQLNKAQAAGQTGLGSLIQQLTALNGANTSSLTFQQITQGITAAQEAQQKLTGALPAANNAVNAQQKAVDGLTSSLEADQKALQGQQDKLTGLQAVAQAATEKYTAFKDTVQTATAALDASNQVLANDTQPLKDTAAAIKNVDDALKIAGDTTKSNFDPKIQDMTQKVTDAREALQLIQNNIKEKQIAAMHTGAQATDTLTTSNFNLSDQIVTHTTPDIQKLGDTAAGPKGVSKDVDTLSAATGPDGLTGAMDTLYPQVDIATQSLQAFDKAILSAQQDAAKGIDLDIRIHSSGGGGVPGHATGTSFSGGGLSMVGEFGPELVNLPSGSQVIPNTGAGGGFASNVPPIVLAGNTFIGTSTDMLQQIARMLETEQQRLVTFGA